MVRLTPPGNERLERTTSLDLTVGGAELNSAATLACLDVSASWVSRLPDVPLGRAVARGARAAGVDLSHLQWVPESAGRAGVYYLEEASDPRPSAVYYDRADSAFARMPPGAFDWPIILNGARALHISGITPALGPGPRAETMAAIRAANAASVPVAFDLNYRSKLWSETDARACFGLAVTILSRKRGKASRSVRLGSMAMGQDGQAVEGPWRDIEVIDRLGGGDAFAGGFIAGYITDP